MSASRQLKALHIASGDLWAGAEVQLFTLLTQLHRRGDVIPQAVLMNDGELARRLRAEGIHVDVIDEGRFGAARILWRLLRVMREWRPDVVHTHRTKENVLGALANALSVRAPCVRTVHGAPEYRYTTWRQLPKRAFSWLDRFCGRFLQDRIIAVSGALLETLSNFFSRRKLVKIENGVDIDAVREAIRSANIRVTAPNAHHIAIVGRLQPVKRVDIFLAMAALLLSEGSRDGWCFHVIGDGPLRSALSQQAVDLGIAHAVIFHGHRSDPAACIAEMDALVMCSDHEGLPMTALEALAVGTPVLAHAVGGLVDLFGGGAGGAVVMEHSPAAYARELKNLMGSGRCYMEGVDELLGRYSAKANAAHVTSLYHSLRGFT